MSKLELLAPAGDLRKLKTALAFGADAVYFGLPAFSLRSRLNPFDKGKVKEAMAYVHQQGRRAYLTFNIYPHSRHLKELPKYVDLIAELKPDALIMSDPGIISFVKEKLPEIPRHLSTQANCTNWRAAKFWHEQGIKRIILAREVILEDVKEIHQKVPKLELEYFVHGAMCMAYSGRCILSKWLTGRSANLGDCSQPCRWKYHLTEEKHPGEYMPIEEDQHGTYIMNSKDICLIEHIDELRQAGVCSVKIEGRTKSIYYVANIVKAYRQAIDGDRPVKELRQELDKITNRGYIPGFLFGEEKCEHNLANSHNIADWQFVGEVIEYDRKKETANIKVHNEIHQGDKIEFVVPGGDNFTQKLDKFQDTESGEELTEAHGGAGQKIIVNPRNLAPKYSVLRRKI
ncbi:U32 family peptidase C-terminal domain-containing protein [Patescibacteria group bacterium]|nr:U32 family peptidase C-terminal domain-containing protein [Patescibacteria group bacterium]